MANFNQVSGCCCDNRATWGRIASSWIRRSHWSNCVLNGFTKPSHYAI